MESRTKFCKKCSCVKDYDKDFHRGTNICKLCKIKYNKEYYAKKKENKYSTNNELLSEVSCLTKNFEEMNLGDLRLELQKINERVTQLEFENLTLKLEFENYKMNKELEELRKERK
jgi:predicted nuclease with TOPRIM domain